MHDTLSGRAEELGRLTDLIRTSLSLADSSIPAINAQLDELAAMGLDNLELEGQYAERYGESGHEPPDLRERFAPYDRLPAIVRATLPAHAPKLLVQLLQSFSVLTR